MNLAVRKLGCPAFPCRTAVVPLLEGSMANLAAFTARKQEQHRELLTKEMAKHLIRYHGTGINRVMETAAGDAELLKPLSPTVTVCAAEVLHTARKEMAVHLDDVIFRRTGMGTIGCPDETALNQGAAIMAATWKAWISAASGRCRATPSWTQAIRPTASWPTRCFFFSS